MTPDVIAEKEPSRGGSEPSKEHKDTPLFGKGTLIALAGIFIILIVFLAVAGGLPGTPRGAAVPPAACGDKAIQYINTNLVQPGTSASLVSVGENGNIYTITIRYQSQTSTLYTTDDCNLLFPSAINMSIPAASPVQQQPPKRSPRPSVDLYVMAFCPYGTQAETAMKPVADLLGSKADIRIRYITTISGSTAASVQSLHGTGGGTGRPPAGLHQPGLPGPVLGVREPVRSAVLPLMAGPDRP